MPTGADRPRIALIHATPVAMEPVRRAMASRWPGAEPANLLDDSLSADRAASPDITPALTQRIVDLARYARGAGAHAILFTCSAFGSAIERAADELDVPVLKPNEAMFDAAIARGDRVAMIATFGPARAGMEEEFAEQARRRGSAATLTSFVVPAAMAALRTGDEATHNRLVAEQARELRGFDTIVLAHFSTSIAAPAVEACVAVPVLTAAEAAVDALRRRVEAGEAVAAV